MSSTLCNVCGVPVKGTMDFLCPKHVNAVSFPTMERYRRAARNVLRNRERKRADGVYPIRADDHLAEALAVAYRQCREELNLPIQSK